MAASPVTACECDSPGYCIRHGVKKSKHWFCLCQTRPDYFRAWEEGKGPGQHRIVEQSKRKPYYLGDRIHDALNAVGITEERVTKWIRRPCGCKRRKEKLNRLDQWARSVLSGAVENSKQLLEDMVKK